MSRGHGRRGWSFCLALVLCSSARGEAPRPRLDRFGDPLPPGAIARLGTLRLRQSGIVEAVGFSPDGKTVASSGVWGTVLQLWDTRTGQRLCSIKIAKGSVTSAPVFSPDGRLMAAGIRKAIHLWEVPSGRELRRFEGHQGPVKALRFTEEGKALVSVGLDGVVRRWDVTSGRQLRRHDLFGGKPRRLLLDHFPDQTIERVTLSDNGRVVAWVVLNWKIHKGGHGLVSGESFSVVLQDVATGTVRWRRKRSDSIRLLALSPDGVTLALSEEQGNLELWQVATGTRVQLLSDRGNHVFALAFSPDGKTLAGEQDGLVCWDVATGKERRLAAEAGDARWNWRDPISLAFSRDGKTLAGCNGIHLRMWDMKTEREVPRLDGHRGPVGSLLFSPDGRTLTSVGDERLCRWETEGWTETARLSMRALKPYSPRVLSLDGKHFINRAENGDLQLCDIATGRMVQAFPGKHSPILSGAFAADGRTFALRESAGKEDYLVRYDAATGKASSRALPPDQSITLAPDGRSMAWGERDGIIYLADATTRKRRRKLGKAWPAEWKSKVPPQTGPLVFSPDGCYLAAWTSGDVATVRVWETATGRILRQMELCSLPVPQTTRKFYNWPDYLKGQLAFAPDNRLLAVAAEPTVIRWLPNGERAYQPTIRLYEVASGQEYQRFRGHREPVSVLAFTPNGKALVSGSQDSTLLVWDVRGPAPARRKPTPDALREWWADLAARDPVRAQKAVQALAACPGESVPFLREQFQGLRAGSTAETARLLTDLDSDRFEVRQAATRRLEALGEAAEPHLLTALRGRPPLEVRRRMEELLAKIDGRKLALESIRLRRALEVLEKADTPPARLLLTSLANRAPSPRLSRQAKESIQRMARPRATKP